MKNILFFTAPYCAACKILKPKVEEIIVSYQAQIINIDTTTGPGKESAVNAGVTVLPTVVVLAEDGTQLKRWDGGISTIQSELPTILKGNTENTEGSKKNLMLVAAFVGVGLLALSIGRKKKKKYEDIDND